MAQYVEAAAVVIVLAALVRRRTVPRFPADAVLLGDSYAEGLAPPLGARVRQSGREFRSRYQRGAGAQVVDWARAALDADDAVGVLVSVGANVTREVWPPLEGGMHALRRDYPGRVVWLLPPVGLWPADIESWMQRPARMKLVDGVHPAREGYAAWAARIARVVL